MPIQKVPDPEMVTKSAQVAEGYTKEMYSYLLSLLPTPQSYAEQHDRFEASYTASLKGDPDKVKACESDRSAVNESVTILRGVAKALAIKDPNIEEALGLHIFTEKGASSAGSILEVPVGFKVKFNPKGELFGGVSRIPAAKFYQVWACDDDPNVEENWRLAAFSENCRGIAITGLNRNKTNWLKIRGMRGNTCGPWSDCITLPPIR